MPFEREDLVTTRNTAIGIFGGTLFAKGVLTGLNVPQPFKDIIETEIGFAVGLVCYIESERARTGQTFQEYISDHGTEIAQICVTLSTLCCIVPNALPRGFLSFSDLVLATSAVIAVSSNIAMNDLLPTEPQQQIRQMR